MDASGSFYEEYTELSEAKERMIELNKSNHHTLVATWIKSDWNHAVKVVCNEFRKSQDCVIDHAVTSENNKLSNLKWVKTYPSLDE